MVDVWQIVQINQGSRLVVTLRRPGQPLPYGAHGVWTADPDRVTRDFTGTESTKLGHSTQASSGRAGSLRLLPDGAAELIVRAFKVHDALAYADHPYGRPRNDQVFQAWDGFGFGELEVRTPALDAARERRLEASTELWIFTGESHAVVELSHDLLKARAVP